MSMCRRSEGGDLYILYNSDTMMECNCCPLRPKQWGYHCAPWRMVFHVLRHRWAGHEVVPRLEWRIFMGLFFEKYTT